MKKDLVFVKDYRNDGDLRKSFNELALNTFGIQFETWYQLGYWAEKYQPYSFVENGQVVANVSVNLLNFIIKNEAKKAIQIGTVMTHPDYRNQGLSRKLMEKVLEDYKDVDFFYLFANQSVLDFYPKFGFYPMKQVQFSLDYKQSQINPSRLRKLDGNNRDDLAFIYNFGKNRVPLSKEFSTSDGEELLMFYCSMVFTNDLYYMEDEKALVIYQIEEDTLHMIDVVSTIKVNIERILSKITNEKINKVVFHFHLDEDSQVNFMKEPYQDGHVLFVKNMTGVQFPDLFKHPITSQA